MITALQIEQVDHAEVGRLIDQVFCQVKPPGEITAAEKDGSIYAVVAEVLNNKFVVDLSYEAQKLYTTISGGVVDTDNARTILSRLFAVIGRDVLMPILQTGNYGIDRKLEAITSILRAYNAQHQVTSSPIRELLYAVIKACHRISGAGWNAKAVTSRLCSLVIEATK